MGRELVRWLLFLPMLVVGLFLFAVLINCGRMVGGPSGVLGEIICSGLLGYCYIKIVFELAPRGKVILGRFFYGLAVLGIVGGIALSIARPDVLPFRWVELAKGLLWCFLSTGSLVESTEKLAAAERAADVNAGRSPDPGRP